MSECDNRYPFFTNKECECFPCHEGIAEEDFNCAFCYCPLYALGPDCGGNFEYTESGIKSCMNCSKPHQSTRGIDLVTEHWPMLRELARRKAD